MPAEPASHTQNQPAGPFEDAAEAALTRLRATMSQFVASSPGDVKRATDLQRVLGVRASLAWQVFRVATAKGPFETVPHIPRSESMAKIFDAARNSGFPAASVDQASAAFDEFEQLVARHARNRDTFEAMVAAQGGELGEQISFKQRRAAFRANANLWGFQAATFYRCTIVHHESGAAEEDAVAIRGLLGLRVNRRMPSLPIAYRGVIVNRDHALSPAQPELPTPWVLEDFCSSPLPEFSTVQEGNRCTDTLHALGVGETARLDYFLAMVIHNAPLQTQPPSAGGGVLISIPTQELVMDLLVPRGLYDPQTLRSNAYAHPLIPDRAMQCEEDFRIPPQSTATHLGTSVDALHDPLVPRCPEMIRYVLKKLEWDDTAFDAYRCRARFPTLHTVIDLRVDGLPVE
jgi:hypothetical protein